MPPSRVLVIPCSDLQLAKEVIPKLAESLKKQPICCPFLLFCCSVHSNTLAPAQFRNLCQGFPLTIDFFHFKAISPSQRLFSFHPFPLPLSHIFSFLLSVPISQSSPVDTTVASNTAASNSPFPCNNPTNLLAPVCSELTTRGCLPVSPVRCAPTWSVSPQNLEATH